MLSEDDLKICRALVQEADNLEHRLDVLKTQLEGHGQILSLVPGRTGVTAQCPAKQPKEGGKI